MSERIFRIRHNGLHRFEVVEHIVSDDNRYDRGEVISYFIERYLAEKEVERLNQQKEGGG